MSYTEQDKAEKKRKEGGQGNEGRKIRKRTRKERKKQEKLEGAFTEHRSICQGSLVYPIIVSIVL